MFGIIYPDSSYFIILVYMYDSCSDSAWTGFFFFFFFFSFSLSLVRMIFHYIYIHRYTYWKNYDHAGVFFVKVN